MKNLAPLPAVIAYGECDSTSTSTAFTATIPNIDALYDGVTILLKNGVVTSASGFTININGLGAKPVYTNMAAATAETTIFNIAYTMLFVYDSTRVTGGCWICYRGYDSNTNTIGYQLRTNSTILKTYDKSRYYRIFFTSADGTHWVPANTGTDNSATSSKTVNQRPIDPFGRIVYCSDKTSYAAEADIAAANVWEQYNLTLGYSFNRTGAALTLTSKRPVYIKCAPQSNGSAIIDSVTPYVQALPSTEDGKIYIFLGIATSATAVELQMEHPVYYYKDGAVRLWTNQVTPSVPSAATATPLVDGTAAVGTSAKYAKEDHVHPTDTSRAAVSSVPASASINNQKVVSFKNTNNTELFNLQLPRRYDGYSAESVQKIPVDYDGVSFTTSITPEDIIEGFTVDGEDQPSFENSTATALYIGSSGAELSERLRVELPIVNFINSTDGIEFQTVTSPLDSIGFIDEIGYASVTTYSGYDQPYHINIIHWPLTSAATAAPLMDGTASVGSSSNYAKEDHVHPSDTSKANVSSVPSTASIGSNGLITFKNSNNTSLFTLQLPIYQGGAS